MYRHVHYWFIKLLTNIATSASQLLFDIKACASVNSRFLCHYMYIQHTEGGTTSCFEESHDCVLGRTIYHLKRGNDAHKHFAL